MVLHVHGLPDVSLQGLHEVRGPELGPGDPWDGVRLEPGSRSSRRSGSVVIRAGVSSHPRPGSGVHRVHSGVSGLHLVGGTRGGRGSGGVAGAGGGRGVGGGSGGGQTHRRRPEVCVGMGEI